MIAGDSTGATEFWSGITGTVIQSFRDHMADILAIAVDPSKKCVYVSGVDSRVSKIERTSNDVRFINI